MNKPNLYIQIIKYYEGLIEDEEKTLENLFQQENTDALDLNIHDITDNIITFRHKIDFLIKELDKCKQTLYKHEEEDAQRLINKYTL